MPPDFIIFLNQYAITLYLFECRDTRTLGSWFFPSPLWVLGIKTMWSGSAASAFILWAFSLALRVVWGCPCYWGCGTEMLACIRLCTYEPSIGMFSSSYYWLAYLTHQLRRSADRSKRGKPVSGGHSVRKTAVFRTFQGGLEPPNSLNLRLGGSCSSGKGPLGLKWPSPGQWASLGQLTKESILCNILKTMPGACVSTDGKE